MIALLGLAGVLAWYMFLRTTEVHNGVVHFTSSAREKAMGELARVGVAQTAMQVTGGNLTLITTSSAVVTAVDAVNQAESVGGVVLLSDAFLDRPVGSLLVVCSPGQASSVATPGSGLAVLSMTPG